MKYVREIFDMIFNFGTFAILMMAGFVYILLQVADSEDCRHELRQKQTAYCYSQNMILVETDAGRHCTPASSLVVIK